MANAIELVKKINSKLGFLLYLKEETEEIMGRKDPKEIERQLKVYETKLDEFQDLKVQIQETKLEEGEDPADVRKWRIDIEDNLKDCLALVSGMRDTLEGLRNEKKKKQHESELELEKARFLQRLEHESKLVELKGKTQLGEKPVTTVKLPKLEITKFRGTHMDWFRFWNQFETEVDRQNLDPVTKFNYLKEFIEPKVCIAIDNLQHTTEGYERAKTILKSKYGKPSEVINAHVQSIIALPVIKGTNPYKIHDFYNKLLPSVQALESLGKIKEISGYTRLTLDKLEGIRADLVRLDDKWQEWGFPKLVEALSKWTERNPLTQTEGRDRVFTASKTTYHQRACIYCENINHKSTECKKVTKIHERREILKQKRLCFNCTGAGHRASDCPSKGSCRNCRGKHHTSVCDKLQPQADVLLITGEQGVVHPVIVVKVEGVVCRALLDTGAGSSYVSTRLIEKIGKKPIKREQRQIDMMLSSRTTTIEIYNIEVKNLKESFSLRLEVSKVDRGELLTVPNPEYDNMIRRFAHLRGVHMEENSGKDELPIHVIIGASDYSKIKTSAKPRVGRPGEPVAELTNLGWTIMSPGHETDFTNMLFAQSTAADYGRLCSLDVLGLEESDEKQSVYQDFKAQLERREDGRYQTGLIWKSDIPELPNNKTGSKARLGKLVQRLEKQPELYDKYERILMDQEEQGIIEKVSNENPNGREFYLPHRAVVRDTAESTKVRIVFDASARADDKSPSLNDCLETGPPLQNLIWDILTRNRLQPVTLTGDLKQAFLQIQIREQDRDVLRFHWLKDRDIEKLETYRFTRVLFGLNQSPFLLGGTLMAHLDECEREYPHEVGVIKASLYVDDLILGADTVQEVEHLKTSASEIFNKAKFTLHKWHSNQPDLEKEENAQGDTEESYAKQQLGAKEQEVKLLGLAWETEKDTLSISLGSDCKQATKREVLRRLAMIYDPLGLLSAVTLVGKIIFRDICDAHVTWDEEFPGGLKERWLSWIHSLPEKVEIPRSIPKANKEITTIDLHVFADASLNGVATVVYAIIEQGSDIEQGLITSKSRLSKKGLTIPRLELVAGHMAANIVDNVKKALQGYPVRDVHAWLDSSVALHWIKSENRYKQFVSNRVTKIKEKDYLIWRHVPSELNPADIASRGCDIKKVTDSWFKGPDWIQKPDQWPEDIVTVASRESESEAKPCKVALNVGVETSNELDTMLEKFHFMKAMRVTAWLKRFADNCRREKSERKRGLLDTDEMQRAINVWIKRTQIKVEGTEVFLKEKEQLGLQKNEQGIYVFHGRIQGEYPVYLPSQELFSETIVVNAHRSTLCGGSGLTMAEVRQTCWIPRLRTIAKRVRKSCYACKRFHAVPFEKPKISALPKERTEGSRPFEVVGIDYAGPITFKTKRKGEGKAHILLIACSLTRAVYLELLPDTTVANLIPCLKRFIARRGRPKRIYSDNAQTFKATAKWLKSIMRDEKVKAFLINQSIVWQFNLSKAPWWGGQYERIIGLTKQVMYKVLGNAKLSFEELGELLLDIEVILNNRPLSYIEDDVQLPILTPNMMLLSQNNALLDPEPSRIQEKDLRRRAKYLQKCRENLWKRWHNEYVRSLRERHDLRKKDSKSEGIHVGQVVLVKGDERNRGEWNIGIVEQLIRGHDGVMRGARLKSKKTRIERAVELLYPLELECKVKEAKELNPQAIEFKPKRRAAERARETVAETFRYEERDLQED